MVIDSLNAAKMTKYSLVLRRHVKWVEALGLSILGLSIHAPVRPCAPEGTPQIFLNLA